MRRVISFLIVLGMGVLCCPNDGLTVTREEITSSKTWFDINIPARQLTVYHRQRPVHQFTIAVGQARYKTPVGPRFLKKIVWNPWWIPPNSAWAINDKPTPPGRGNPLGPVKMKLGQGIMLHGTSNERSVGRAASHGCMRMYNQDAKTLAWWVQSRFTDKDDPDLLDTYAANGRTSYHVQLPNPVPVYIRYEIFEIQDRTLKVYPDIYWKVGNKVQAAYQFLASKGYNTDEVNKRVLKQIIKAANKNSSQILLKKLIPGKLTASNARPLDIYEKAWVKKVHRFGVTKYANN
jgi:hypothetical protein